MIRNHHSRTILASAADAARLLDQLGNPDDLLWPGERWPAMRFKEGHRIGSEGRHGPIRYRVTARDERNIRMRFTGPSGFHGWHGFEAAPEELAGVRLIHRMHMQPTGWARIYWPLALRWLHDACIEDALDKAQARLEGHAWTPRPLGLWVRVLRRLLRRKPRTQPPSARTEGSIASHPA